MIENRFKLIFIALLLLFSVFPASAQSDYISESATLVEGEFVDLGDGYFLNVVEVDTFNEMVRISITKDRIILSDFFYEEGDDFYFEDKNLLFEFYIEDTYSDGFTRYVDVSDVYYERYTGPGFIVVYTEPVGADVYVDDIYVGTTFSDWFWIDARDGYHEVEFVKDGYYTNYDEIYVSPGEPTYHSVTLEPIPIIDDGRNGGGTDPLGALIGLILLLLIILVPIILIIVLLKKRKAKKEEQRAGWKRTKPAPGFEEKVPKAPKPEKEKIVPKTPVEKAKTVIPPVKKKEPVTEPMTIDSQIEYMGTVIRYSLNIKNNSTEPVSDIRAKLKIPDRFILKDDEKTIPMIESGKSKEIQFDIRPAGECRDCTVSGSVSYYDHSSKERKEKDLETRNISVICPSLRAEEVDENSWRQAVSGMVIAEEYSKDLEIPVENLFDIVTRVLKDMNLYMIEPEITSTPQLYTGVARFYGLDDKGLQHAAYAEVVGKRRSRLTLKAWAEDAESLTGFYHCMLSEIEKRTDIRIFVEEGVTQYTTISSTTIQDSLIQKSTIGASKDKRKCPKCGREAKEGDRFCMDCGEKLE